MTTADLFDAYARLLLRLDSRHLGVLMVLTAACQFSGYTRAALLFGCLGCFVAGVGSGLLVCPAPAPPVAPTAARARLEAFNTTELQHLFAGLLVSPLSGNGLTQDLTGEFAAALDRALEEESRA